MKPILLYNFCIVDLAIVPNFVADDLVKYQMQFRKLMRRNDYKYGHWFKLPDGRKKFAWGNDTFIKWLNEEIIEDENEKAAIIKEDVAPYDEKLELPKVYF